MIFHYFDQDKASEDDLQLKMAIQQGYVPSTCLLAGMIIMDELHKGNDPCSGCNGPREKCHGRKRKYD